VVGVEYQGQITIHKLDPRLAVRVRSHIRCQGQILVSMSGFGLGVGAGSWFLNQISRLSPKSVVKVKYRGLVSIWMLNLDTSKLELHIRSIKQSKSITKLNKSWSWSYREYIRNKSTSSYIQLWLIFQEIKMM